MNLVLPYTLKKCVAECLMPVPLAVGLFVLGWAVSKFTRFARLGKWIKGLSAVLGLAFACGWGGGFLYRLERLYPPLEADASTCEALKGCDILVLGQGMEAGSDLPLRYRNNAVFQQRLLEGVRLTRAIPGSRVLVSMAGGAVAEDKERFLSEYALTVGLPRERLVPVFGARDTSEEAQRLLARARTNRVVVATSAAHMPRAVRILQKHGADPVAAPCDYIWARPRERKLSLRGFPRPSVGGLEVARRAQYERLGLWYEALSSCPVKARESCPVEAGLRHERAGDTRKRTEP